MDKGSAVNYFVEYLHNQIAGDKDSVGAGKIFEYLQCHRRPGQSFPEYHNNPEDVTNELHAALILLKAVGETVIALPQSIVRFLFLTRRGMAEDAQATNKTGADDNPRIARLTQVS